MPLKLPFRELQDHVPFLWIRNEASGHGAVASSGTLWLSCSIWLVKNSMDCVEMASLEIHEDLIANLRDPSWPNDSGNIWPGSSA